MKITREEAEWLKDLLEDMDADSLSDEKTKAIMNSLYKKAEDEIKCNPA